MKPHFSFLIILLAVIFASCNNQNCAVEQASDIKEIVKRNSPDYISTNARFYMKAKIDGKKWKADKIMSSYYVDNIVGRKKGKKLESISLPFQLRNTKTGATLNFKDYAVDIIRADKIVIWGGHQGEMMFTKVTDDYADDTFNALAIDEDTDKRLVITEPVFRTPFMDE